MNAKTLRKATHSGVNIDIIFLFDESVQNQIRKRGKKQSMRLIKHCDRDVCHLRTLCN